MSRAETRYGQGPRGNRGREVELGTGNEQGNEKILTGGPAVTETGKWNQALAVSRSNKKYRQGSRGNRGIEVKPGTRGELGNEEI